MVQIAPLHGVRPRGWTVSCRGFDSLPGVVILELCWGLGCGVQSADVVDLIDKARFATRYPIYCPNNVACFWRSSRLSNLPLGFLGKESENTMCFGTLNRAKCSAQWA